MVVAVTGTIPAFSSNDNGLISATVEANQRAIARRAELAALAEEREAKRVDRVEISQQAVDRAQADEATKQVPNLLIEEPEPFVSLEPGFDETV